MTNAGKRQHMGRKGSSTALWTLIEVGGMNLMRLGSNLVLTRLLFPEAFGLMALVTVYLTAMTMVSDTGIQISILQNQRGDTQRFLDTAWTIQLLRGCGLWVLTLGLAWPMAALYQEPELAPLLILCSLTLLLNGASPAKRFTAERHMAVGALTRITLAAQALGIVVMILLAWHLQSVWALGIGTVLTMAIQVSGMWLFLPGPRSRLCLDREIMLELFRFGKYVMLSSLMNFVFRVGDRTILGFFLDLSTIGIYSIGAQLGMMPRDLIQILSNRLVIPAYRMHPLSEAPENRRIILRLRRLIALGMLAVVLVLAFVGPALITLLYDPRYHLAGAVVMLLAISMVPILTQSYHVPMHMALGDSRRAFHINALTAVLQVLGMVAGLYALGLFGGILAIGIANLLSAPLRLFYARRVNGQDWVQDLLMPGAGLAIGAMIIWFHWDLARELMVL